MRSFQLVPALLLLSAVCFGQTDKPFTLFNPTPRDQMRDFSIDRPDVTESPITVDPGHFQFEGDLYKITFIDNNTERLTNILSGLYKLGLSHSWDIHFGVEAYNIYAVKESDYEDKGFGSTAIRLKHNFWGNDGESKTAFGMIPYVVFLSGNPFDSEVAYGVGFPFSYDLSEKLGAGAQAQVDFVPNEDGGHDLSFFQTVVLGGPLVGNLDFYVEGMGTFYEGGNWFAANGGLIYNVTKNVKVDIATNIGLTDDAPSRLYLGLSFRI